jgi:hypothetical protein
MKKSAEDLAIDVLGQEAKERKRRERWISTLTGSALGTAASLATKNMPLRQLPAEAITAGLAGLMFAELPRILYKDPVKDADDPRWWRKDYSPVEQGLALGAGGGVGALGGNLLLKALRSKGMLVPDVHLPFKGFTGTVATLALPSIAGYLGARQLMRMRDARRDANAQIPNSPATV